MKKLITIGDSWTDADFKSIIHPEYNTDYAKWPEHLNSLFNEEYELINLGLSGASNDYIFAAATEQIVKYKDEIGLIILGTTEHSRISYGLMTWSLSADLNRNIHNITDTNDDTYLTRLVKTYMATENKIAINTYITSYLSRIHLFQTLCETLDIPHLVVPMLPPIDFYVRRELHNKLNRASIWTPGNVSKALLGNTIFDEIIEENVFGWPFLKNLGGNCMGDIIPFNMRISTSDPHPNAEGHKIIAKYIYNISNNLNK